MIIVAMAAKRIPLEKPELLPWLRGLFFASNIGILGCCFVIHWKIRQNGDPLIAQQAISVTEVSEADAAPAVLSEQHAQEASQCKQMTVYTHDREFLLALYKLPLRGLLVVALMHFYMKSTKSLLLQTILPLKALWEADIFRVHVRGHATSGKLQRPWKKRKGPRQLVTDYVGFAIRFWKGEQTKGRRE